MITSCRKLRTWAGVMVPTASRLISSLGSTFSTRVTLVPVVLPLAGISSCSSGSYEEVGADESGHFCPDALCPRRRVRVGRVSQIERGEVTGVEVLARYADALGGRLRVVIDFGDELIAV
jgi:hypothetical protein